MIILAEDSLGWQNRLIDKASVQFRLTAKNLGALKGSFFLLLKMCEFKINLASKKSINKKAGDSNGKK